MVEILHDLTYSNPRNHGSMVMQDLYHLGKLWRAQTRSPLVRYCWEYTKMGLNSARKLEYDRPLFQKEKKEGIQHKSAKFPCFIFWRLLH